MLALELGSFVANKRPNLSALGVPGHSRGGGGRDRRSLVSSELRHVGSWCLTTAIFPSLKWDQRALAHRVRLSDNWALSEQGPAFCRPHSRRAANTGSLRVLFRMALCAPGLVFSPSVSLSFPIGGPSLPGRPFPRVSPGLLPPPPRGHSEVPSSKRPSASTPSIPLYSLSSVFLFVTLKLPWLRSLSSRRSVPPGRRFLSVLFTVAFPTPGPVNGA